MVLPIPDLDFPFIPEPMPMPEPLPPTQATPPEAPIAPPGGDFLQQQPLDDLLGPQPQQGQPGLTPVAYRPEQLRGMNPKTAELYRRLDAMYPDDIRFTSGYRSPGHNARVGGSKRSRHMSGDAFDFNVNRKFRTEELQNLTANARRIADEMGLPLSGGYYGLNPQNGHAMHFDTRPGGGVTWGADRRVGSTPDWFRQAVHGQVDPSSPNTTQLANRGGAIGPGGPRDAAEPPGVLPQGPKASSDAGGARAAAEYPGPQQTKPEGDDPVRHQPQWAGAGGPSNGLGLGGPSGPMPGGDQNDPMAAYLEAARRADEQQRMQQAFAGMGKAFGQMGKGSPYPPASAPNQNTAASKNGLNAIEFARLQMLDQGRGTTPSDVMKKLNNMPLFA